MEFPRRSVGAREDGGTTVVKVLTLIPLTAMVACGVAAERDTTTEARGASAEARAVVDAAQRLGELQNELQPNSWDVSLEESFLKENPLTPPVLRHGKRRAAGAERRVPLECGPVELQEAQAGSASVRHRLVGAHDRSACRGRRGG